RSPNAFGPQLRDQRARPLVCQFTSNLLPESRLLEKDAARKNEFDGASPFSKPGCTSGGVPGQTAGGAFQNVAGDSLPFCGRAEDLKSKCGDFRFACALRPGDQIVGFIQLQGAQKILTKHGPDPIAII